MAEVEWKGGRVLVSPNDGGWSIVHLTIDGGIFSLDWDKHKSKAIEMGRGFARNRSARLFVEEAL